jgi:hypothetical protein
MNTWRERCGNGEEVQERQKGQEKQEEVDV